jgi:hypothetical protein
MLATAEALAADLPLVRVDFYEINGDLYFGEMTLYPASGLGPFIPREFDFRLGAELALPERSEHVPRK